MKGNPSVDGEQRQILSKHVIQEAAPAGQRSPDGTKRLFVPSSLCGLSYRERLTSMPY